MFKSFMMENKHLGFDYTVQNICFPFNISSMILPKFGCVCQKDEGEQTYIFDKKLISVDAVISFSTREMFQVL
jgi:hypothetical protein